MTPEILAALEQARAEKRPVVVATKLPDGEQRLLPDPAAPDRLNEIARAGADLRRQRHAQRSTAWTGSCTPITRRTGW